MKTARTLVESAIWGREVGMLRTMPIGEQILAEKISGDTFVRNRELWHRHQQRNAPEAETAEPSSLV